MTFLVPYDESYLADAALTRATEYAGNIAEDATYDVHIVRYVSPTAVQKLESSGGYPDEAR